MTISSRTPEGHSNHCPVCDSDVRVEPSANFGGSTCPKCGTLLWFLQADDDVCYYERASLENDRNAIFAFFESHTKQLRLNPARLAALRKRLSEPDTDSLDLVELVMELEEV